MIVCDDVVISIHAPPRGATASRNATMRRGTFQFTPLREGRRSGRRLSRRKTPISIHAPPRGATYLLGNGVELENISIHAPPRGATSPRCPKRRASRNFNSRPSARGDAKRDGEKKEHIVFQFTPLREGRLAKNEVLATGKIFQFTPLREGRRLNFGDVVLAKQFQFTPLREGRPQRRNQRHQGGAFQFTPLREGRPHGGGFNPDALYFNSRPSARGDEVATYISVEREDFNSRPSARGDARDLIISSSSSISIHAPPRGATAKDMQFLQIFCSTLTNQHGLTIVPRNLSRLFW